MLLQIVLWWIAAGFLLYKANRLRDRAAAESDPEIKSALLNSAQRTKWWAAGLAIGGPLFFMSVLGLALMNS